MIFELADDLAEALAALPASHPRRRLLTLLLEAIRRDMHFIDRHPATLFQCLWNSGWWHDSPKAVARYVAPKTGWTGNEPWSVEGEKFSSLLETWREEKNRQTPGFSWMRALRPPPLGLGSRQKFLLGAHEEVVPSIAWSADGEELVSVSSDQTVRIWNARTGVQSAIPEGPAVGWRCVAWSKNGRLIAAGDKEGGITFWDAVTRTPLRTMKVSEGWMIDLAIAPDSARMLSTESTGVIRCWDLATFQEIYSIAAPQVGAIAFSPDGRRFAAGLDDKSVRVWNSRDGSEIPALQRQLEQTANDVRFTPDGQRLAAATSHGIRLWSLRPSAELGVFRVSETIDGRIAFSPDGTWFAAASSRPMYERGMNPLLFEERIRLCDAETGVERAGIVAHQEGFRGIDVSPDGRLIASWSFDHTLRLWDSSTLAEVRVLRSPDRYFSAIDAAVFTPDGRGIVMVNNRVARIIDLQTGEVALTLDELDKAICAVACLPDGRIVCACIDESIRIQQAGAMSMELRMTGHERRILCLAASADGALIASGSEDATARIWNVSDGAERAVLRGHSDTVKSVAFSPDGALLVTGSADKLVRTWNTATGQAVAAFPGHTNDVHTVAFHPDGTRFFSGSSSAYRIWNPDGDQDAQTVVLGDDLVFAYSLAMSPAGDAIACQHEKHGIAIWDLSSRTRREAFAGHQDTIYEIAWSPDGTQIATSSGDHTVRIWSAAGESSAAAPLEVLGDRTRTWRTVSSEDGRYVLTGTRLWDVQAGTGKDLACFRSTGPDGWGPQESYTPVTASRAAFAGNWDLAAALDDLTLRTFSLQTAEEIVIAARFEREPSLVEFSSSGGSIAAIHGDVVSIWSAYAAPEPLGVLKGHEQPVACLAWSADGKRIATASDRTVRIWDGSTFAELMAFSADGREVQSVAFSTDRRLIASGEVGGTIRIRDAESGAQIAVLVVETGSVKQVAFSADSTRVFCLDRDDRAFEFDVAGQTRLRTFSGMPDLAALVSDYDLAGQRRGVESAFTDAAGGIEIGWYPEPLQCLKASRADRTWSGLYGGRLHLVRLETEPDTLPEPAPAPAVNAPLDPVPSAGWWAKLQGMLFGSPRPDNFP